MNPTLADLVGGIQSVTLGDEEARRRGTQKSILERKAPPTFDIVVEIQSWERVAVHGDVAETVDAMLRGYKMPAEVRELSDDGEVRVLELPRNIPTDLRADRRGYGNGRRAAPGSAPDRASALPGTAAPVESDQPFRRLYPFGISRKRLEQAIRETAARVAVADDLREADTVMTLRSYFRRKPQALRDAEARGIPIYVLKTNTVAQMEQGLLSMQGRGDGTEVTAPVQYAMQEAEDAITSVLNNGDPNIELTPQNAYIRRLQHQLAQRYNLVSRSAGREPYRRVKIFREDPGAEWPADERW
jgi:hypothetical protein